ncbi:MAG: MoaD/ThiS family protein [Rehaibacterium terrae]|uniref:MoaD/ThiS family protein n=1 Tax=Rehaibacterium terrae TaxID=1341696 RepID=UPI00391D5C95
MKLDLRLFGAFRDLDPVGVVQLDVAEDATVATVREAFAAFGVRTWGERFQPGLLAVSAFASEREVLHDRTPVAGLGELAVLPPVSGG